MTLWPESYIEHWAEVFVRRRVRQRLHIAFEVFLTRPQQFLARVERVEAGLRSAREQLLALSANDERRAPTAVLHGDVLIEPMGRDLRRWRRPWFWRLRWTFRRFRGSKPHRSPHDSE